MRTDRVPIDYLYLSGRLLNDLKEQDEAFRRPRLRKSFSVKLPGLTATVESASPAPESLRAIARRSADLVSDQTGTIEQPGSYVRGELDLYHGVFSPHMGWRGGTVACYRSVVDTENGATTVVLFGSANNIVGRRANTEGEGYYPSDIMGLYTLLSVVREPLDPEIDVDYLIDDVGMSSPARAGEAIHLAETGARMRLGRLDMLFRVFFDEADAELRSGTSVRALIGTPLWIATPAPRPLSPRPDEGA